MRNQLAAWAAFAAVLGSAVAGCAYAPADCRRVDVDQRRSVAVEPCAPWGREVFRVHAKGVQTYRVEIDRDGKLVVKFAGPRADLFDDKEIKIGTHFLGEAGPVWEIGGARVTGRKLRERPSRNVGAIPELQLAATVSGGGELAGVTFVERLHTTGGVAPQLDGSRHAGDTIDVPYTAEYVFYAASR